MRGLCTPAEVPEEWLQFDSGVEGIQIFLNSHNLPRQDWCTAVFHVKKYKDSYGAKKSVLAHDSNGELYEDTLASWISIVKPAVRGNVRGVLFYCKKNGWQRLQTLLRSIAEVQNVQNFSYQNSIPYAKFVAGLLNCVADG